MTSEIRKYKYMVDEIFVWLFNMLAITLLYIHRKFKIILSTIVKLGARPVGCGVDTLDKGRGHHHFSSTVSLIHEHGIPSMYLLLLFITCVNDTLEFSVSQAFVELFCFIS